VSTTVADRAGLLMPLPPSIEPATPAPSLITN